MTRRMSQFIVHEISKGGRGRLGTFQMKPSQSGEEVSYQTPMYFIHTLCGSVPHITRDVFDLMYPVTPNKPQPPIQISIDSTFPFYKVVGPSGRNISTFVGLGNCPSFLTVHNPMKDCISGYNDKNGISIWPRLGRRTLGDQTFFEIVSSFKPNSVQIMSDYDIQSGSSNKRFSKSTQRTVDMLETYLEKNSDAKNVFATVEVGWFEVNETQASHTLAKILEKTHHIEGFFLGGLGQLIVEVKKTRNKKNEDTHEITKDTSPQPVTLADKLMKRETLLPKILEKLPESKPRYVPGPMTPVEIIDLASMGIDMFDSSIVTLMAEEGKVFSFNLQEFLPHNLPFNANEGLGGADATNNESVIEKSISSVLVLKEKRYFNDFSPISSTCNCITCRQHTRAYINHLFNTKELLGPILLMIHNLCSFDRLFEAIRFCIQEDSKNDVKDKLCKLRKMCENL